MQAYTWIWGHDLKIMNPLWKLRHDIIACLHSDFSCFLFQLTSMLLLQKLKIEKSSFLVIIDYMSSILLLYLHLWRYWWVYIVRVPHLGFHILYAIFYCSNIKQNSFNIFPPKISRYFYTLFSSKRWIKITTAPQIVYRIIS